MIPPLEPLARQGGGYTISWDEDGLERRRTSWQTQCAECKCSFSAPEREEAEKMWWDHIRSTHPSAWSTYVRLG